ncbi:4-alpha-glucanotransferase [Desulfotomaculum arcticum]|uniref:4-alpha-glucanotransferase n=1 Tax=Desulfotruncus arcticus DSM 17038 TaxID=1121424 RepID=A0A1I2UEQ9_9FIRM|nr:4-alpha-glucanotransferase [Desulfotruncus arcticus]SFG75685.1 4-alpha-glucanotransferase [Desulfotomaculum arcticum] [Desulfotruncus arcticus DSM 17038]
MDYQQYYSLQQLASLYNIKTKYTAAGGACRETEPHNLLAILHALGVKIESPHDLKEALHHRKQELWRRCCEPVVAVCQGSPGFIELRLPAGTAGCVELACHLENGELHRWNCGLDQFAAQATKVDGVNYITRFIPIPKALPAGYHRCTLNLPHSTHQLLLIVTPPKAYFPLEMKAKRSWGTFMPLYALRSEDNWGAGDFGDLENILKWTGDLGGSFVGTLPLLASFLNEPFEPSPYSPASRLFWNEFYLNINRVAELKHCPSALDLLNSRAFNKRLAELRASRLVDYRHIMSLKRNLLELLSECLANSDSSRHDELCRWTEANPEVKRYARFRAAMEKRNAPWQQWPDSMRSGKLREEDCDPKAERYHLYVQWLAHNQLQSAAAQANKEWPGLYLDLPLGVHPAGYDVWSRQNLFVLNASCGAPPDLLNSGGQNWDFPPLHPEQIRQQHYDYFIDVLRHHMKQAHILRIDHVMGFHRLFWIPAGQTAKNGVYVGYNAKEFYAILTLESNRQKTVLVGEDLGLVPDTVRKDMKKKKILRMFVLPFELKRSGRQLKPNQAPAGSLACLNTHDMQPFAAFWRGSKAADRTALIRYFHNRKQIGARRKNIKGALTCCLNYLSSGPAKIMLVNLEDLWLEKSPQNVPGTTGGYPNWRRKFRKSVEEFTVSPRVKRMLLKVNNLRKGIKPTALFRYKEE